MKRLLTILVFALTVFYGCEKEKTNYLPPEIKFITDNGFIFNDTVLAAGETFKVGIEANSPDANITNFIIRVESDVIETYLDSGMNTPYLHFERYIAKGIKESEKWVFIVRDREGKSAEINLNIETDTSSSYGTIAYYPSIELGAQNSSSGSFYLLSENLIYNLEEAFENQTKIDLCYYYDLIDTDENTIASPGANIDESVYTGSSSLSNWEIRRTTRFKRADITINDFENAHNDSLLIATYGQTEGKRKAKNLQPGVFLSFKNEDGKVGLIKVNTVMGTDMGTVNISLKVQE